jgi:8-amino-7-oxononanoate synthase
VRCTPEAKAQALQDLDARALRRTRRVVEPAGGALLIADGRRYINFCSNDYLGLATHPELAAAMAEAARLHGAGSGASHLVTGHGREHEALEQELAEFTGRERALLFSSGYMANLGVTAALAERGDLVLEDRLNHASLIDAGLLAHGATLRRYPHADAAAARAALDAHAAQRPQAGALLLTDGVFSMDGDLAPLPALAAAAHAQEAWLVVDDAHGLGVIGPHGRGSCEHFGLDARDVPVLVGTLGKACGSFGAFVAGSHDLVELLVQRARTYIYTTALPQPVAAATRAALRLVREDWRRDKLRERIAEFRAAATRLGLPITESTTPIQPLILGEARTALAASEALRAAGLWVTAIRPPTVPQGSARLRITLCAAHEREDIAALTTALARILERPAA